MIRFLEGWELLGSAANCNKLLKVGSNVIFEPSQGRRGGDAIRWPRGNEGSILLDLRSYWVFGMAFKFGDSGDATKEFMFVGDDGVQAYLTFRILNADRLQIKLGSGAWQDTSFVGWSNAAGYHYLECKCKWNVASGYVEIKVDGVIAFRFDGNTAFSAASATNVWYGYAPTYYSWAFVDDIYICDAQAGLTDYQGDIQVLAATVGSVGDLSDWAASPAVAHYLNLDETTPDGDTTRIESDVVGAMDLSTVAANAGFTGLIAALKLTVWASKADTNPRNIRLEMRGGGSTIESADGVLTTLYTPFELLREVDPAGAAFTKASVYGALQVGVKVQS